jgi:hypothetical protein
MDIDRKFNINAISRNSGKAYSHQNAVLFLAKDKAFALTLPTYLEKCREVGAGPDQIRAVELLIERVNLYQSACPGEVKVPDVDPIKESQCLEA